MKVNNFNNFSVREEEVKPNHDHSLEISPATSSDNHSFAVAGCRGPAVEPDRSYYFWKDH
jgi:hypothetical protein